MNQGFRCESQLFPYWLEAIILSIVTISRTASLALVHSNFGVIIFVV